MIFRARPRPSNFAALFFSFLATCLYLFRFWAQSTIFLKDFGTHPRIPFAFDLVLQGAASLLQDVYQNVTNLKLWMQTIVWKDVWKIFLYSIMYLPAYMLKLVRIFYAVLTYFFSTSVAAKKIFSTICSNTPMARHYSWYLFLLCPPVASSCLFPYIHVCTY